MNGPERPIPPQTITPPTTQKTEITFGSSHIMSEPPPAVTILIKQNFLHFEEELWVNMNSTSYIISCDDETASVTCG